MSSSYDVIENNSTDANQPHFFIAGLGFSALGICISNAPYDTGNLAWSITLKVNTFKFIKIVYPAKKAGYVEVLEEVPKYHHYKFIQNGTVPKVAQMVIDYFETGWTPQSHDFNKRSYLSKTARMKGMKPNPVTVGRSRHNLDTRATRRAKSIRYYKRNTEG